MDLETLICLIQDRPVLWDKRQKSYHNRLLTYREWEKVGEIMGSTGKYKNIYSFLCIGCCSKNTLNFSLTAIAARDEALYFFRKLWCGVFDKWR